MRAIRVSSFGEPGVMGLETLEPVTITQDHQLCIRFYPELRPLRPTKVLCLPMLRETGCSFPRFTETLIVSKGT